jgi:hypothetical protein
MYVVLTIDQRSSQHSADRVPGLVERLNDARLGPLVRRFERTAGDEVQGLLADPDATVSRLHHLLRDGGWNVGLGIGDVETPLPRSTRAARGPAFVAAREAVNRSKTATSRLSVVGAGTYREEQLETVLWLWAGVLSRRSEKGWQVADLLETGVSHTDAAKRLGISQSAVTQRARAAGVPEARRAGLLAAQLLGDLLEGGDR